MAAKASPALSANRGGAVLVSEFCAAKDTENSKIYNHFEAVGDVSSRVISRLAAQFGLTGPTALGPRVVGELLAEIATKNGIETDVLERLEGFASIPPSHLDVTGGRDFAPFPPLKIAG